MKRLLSALHWVFFSAWRSLQLDMFYCWKHANAKEELVQGTNKSQTKYDQMKQMGKSWHFISYLTPTKINTSPKKGQIQKDMSYSNHQFSGDTLVFRWVSLKPQVWKPDLSLNLNNRSPNGPWDAMGYKTIFQTTLGLGNFTTFHCQLDAISPSNVSGFFGDTPNWEMFGEWAWQSHSLWIVPKIKG